MYKTKTDRRNAKRFNAIVNQIMLERNIEFLDFDSDTGRQIAAEAKERYSATFRIPYTTKVINKYNDDGTLHPEYLER